MVTKLKRTPPENEHYGIDGRPDTKTPPLVAAVRDELARQGFRWTVQHKLLPNADQRVPENKDLWEGASPNYFVQQTAIAEAVILAMTAELPLRFRNALRKLAGL